MWVIQSSRNPRPPLSKQNGCDSIAQMSRAMPIGVWTKLVTICYQQLGTVARRAVERPEVDFAGKRSESMEKAQLAETPGFVEVGK
jgi:hypothetical protein